MLVHPAITEIGSSFEKGKVYLYFIRGKDRNALIDTGVKQSPQRDILPSLKKLGLTFKDVPLVLNTHGHFDHTGGNAELKQAGAQICCHVDEAAFINNRQYCYEHFFAPAVYEILGNRDQTRKEWELFTEMAGPEVTVDRFLREDDIIDLGSGFKFRVLHIPGHTSGSLGFYWEKEAILFSGDSLPGLHNKEGGLPILTELESYRKSLKRLQELPLNYILQAHDHRAITLPPMHILKGTNIQLFLKESLECAQELESAITTISKTDVPIIKLYDQVIAKLPQSWGFKRTSEIPIMPLNAFVILFNLRRNHLA
jgi:glyoxylase-like metal-dependent hydrolase (beta-lactamase superfamily II)